MPPRSARIELRSDPDRAQRIRYAAQLRHESLSAFVLDAASERAEQVIAASSTTAVPSAFFDELWNALDAAPEPNAALRRRAAARRRVKQR